MHLLSKLFVEYQPCATHTCGEMVMKPHSVPALVELYNLKEMSTSSTQIELYRWFSVL